MYDDTSGSMFGDKLRQTKDAMESILDDLGKNDHLNIIAFSTKVRSWQKEGLVKASKKPSSRLRGSSVA